MQQNTAKIRSETDTPKTVIHYVRNGLKMKTEPFFSKKYNALLKYPMDVHIYNLGNLSMLY